jgi:hypothetical protein
MDRRRSSTASGTTSAARRSEGRQRHWSEDRSKCRASSSVGRFLNGLEAAPVGRSRTGQARAVMISGLSHLRSPGGLVPALSSSVLEPCGSRSPRCCHCARTLIRWAATAPASPTGSSSTSSSRCWCSAAATGASPMPPARRPRCVAAGMSGSPPATTGRPAGRSWPHAGWSARSQPAGYQPRSRSVAAGDRTHPRLGNQYGKAALVHRAATAGGGVLAGAGQCRHRLWPPAPPRLTGYRWKGHPPRPAMTTCWRCR